MNFKFLIISIAITAGFVGGVSPNAEGIIQLTPQEFSQEEIDEMKNKAVLLTLHEVTFTIQLFPEDAPNTVYNFLKLVESGYYDGLVFHRIVPGFVIQAGDPNTKGVWADTENTFRPDPESERGSWGQGGPGYQINEEFNTLQHDRGMVAMARGNHQDSAGSQFFIVHKDAGNALDGEYTAFGRLVPGTYSNRALDYVVGLERDANDAPLDVHKATIQKAMVLDPYFTDFFGEPDRNFSIIKKLRTAGGIVDKYFSKVHNISFDLPYRWAIAQEVVIGDHLNLVIEPTEFEHNVQPQIDATGFLPQVLVLSEERSPNVSSGVSTASFVIRGGDEPKILSNYVFQNDEGRKAHMIVTTQNITRGDETVQFKVIQLHFVNSELSYSIIYANPTEWFRYELNAFIQTTDHFEVMFDGKMQPINFNDNPVFHQIMVEANKLPEPESLPPVRVGGCLIATASYGSELAPQVQQLRELRDNTVLQTESGSAFMAGFNQFYYSFSPMIADYERENPAFKEAVKLTLTPLLTSLALLQYADIDSEYEMLGYGIAVILLNIGMYFVGPAVLITKIRSFYKLQ